LLSLAAGYAAERHQFGDPIWSIGLIQEKLADMQAGTYALESAVYRVTGDLDATRAAAGGSEALAGLDEYVVEYSFIKVFGSEILDGIIDETLRIFGGKGFSGEYPVEGSYHKSQRKSIFDETNEMNRLLTYGQLLKLA